MNTSETYVKKTCEFAKKAKKEICKAKKTVNNIARSVKYDVRAVPLTFQLTQEAFYTTAAHDSVFCPNQEMYKNSCRL